MSVKRWGWGWRLRVLGCRWARESWDIIIWQVVKRGEDMGKRVWEWVERVGLMGSIYYEDFHRRLGLFPVLSTSSPHTGYAHTKLAPKHSTVTVKYPKCTHLTR